GKNLRHYPLVAQGSELELDFITRSSCFIRSDEKLDVSKTHFSRNNALLFIHNALSKIIHLQCLLIYLWEIHSAVACLTFYFPICIGRLEFKPALLCFCPQYVAIVGIAGSAFGNSFAWELHLPRNRLLHRIKKIGFCNFSKLRRDSGRCFP